jgi:phosphate:Na+ symporter
MSIDLWLLSKFFAGIALLMFGLYTFEQSLRYLWGRQLKQYLEAQTKSLRKSIRSGTWISAATTSSTFVSLLLVAFVGAGMLSLSHAVGVVLGANIGTTLNSLLVAYVGFGEIKISKFALPLIAIGGIILMITRNKKWINIASLLIGIGLLFVGLDYMKSSVELFAKSFDLSQYTNLWMFAGVGFVITALLHSQAAMQIITLAALNGWIIWLAPAFAIIIGANIGTTMTALTASLSGSKAHKQIALMHVIQNLIAACIVAIFFNQFLRLCTAWWLWTRLGYGDNPMLATAWFNAVTNIITAIPFIIRPQLLLKLVEQVMPVHQQTHRFQIEKYRQLDIMEETVGNQLRALSQDCEIVKKDLQKYILSLIHKEQVWDSINDKSFTLDQQEQTVQQLYQDINTLYSYFVHLQTLRMQDTDIKLVTRIERQLNSITDSIDSYAKLSPLLQDLIMSKDPVFQELYDDISSQILHHTLDQTPSPTSDELRDMFIPAVKHASDTAVSMDIATIIGIQHQLAHAYALYHHLSDEHIQKKQTLQSTAHLLVDQSKAIGSTLVDIGAQLRAKWKSRRS